MLKSKRSTVSMNPREFVWFIQQVLETLLLFTASARAGAGLSGHLGAAMVSR